MKLPCVYIMTNKRNGTLYTGITSDLIKRVWQHREGVVEGFTKKYACKLLVWYEVHEDMNAAILREKQIKGGNRKQKLNLIETLNPNWQDLYGTLLRVLSKVETTTWIASSLCSSQRRNRHCERS